MPKKAESPGNLPVGTVTFMFTDIEGSTELLKQLGDQYAEMLEQQRRIMREASKRWDGTEVDTQGDSFFVSFPRATQAISAAVEIQRSIHEHSWPNDVELRLRMGMHTGEPLTWGEGYVGMDVHRAARVAHVGHGGQVLLSETTTALILDELPDGVSLLDLGRHLLKDLPRPERIRQLTIEGLPSEFPPLTSIEKLPTVELRESRQVGNSPYQGLAAFREENAHFFFGREDFTARLMEAVAKHPLVAVIVGSSGSGKSSAVFAGLIPQLRLREGWAIAQLRPGSQPLQALITALFRVLEPDLSTAEQLVETRKLTEAVESGDLPLYDLVDQILDKNREIDHFLLVVDQFEELYTLCPVEDLRGRFKDELLDLVLATSGKRKKQFALLLTLRADFMGQALTHRPFADALQEASLLMGPMTREELRSAVEKPAELQGAAFEPGLVERILDDVGEKPGNLPLLEFALTLLWEVQTDGWLTHADYESIGGVEGALARYADEVFEGLEKADQEQARQIFVQLVKPGEGTEDTRRVALRTELPEDEWSLVQHLADMRLVVTGRDTEGYETVEVVHEALIQRWGQFQRWMQEDREFRSWQERLRTSARGWEVSDRNEGALLRGLPLTNAEKWQNERGDELSSAEVAYIQASLGEREERRKVEQARQAREARLERTRRTLARGLIAVLGIGLAVALGLTFYAFNQRDEARQSADARATAQVEAQSEALARATAQAEAEAQRHEAMLQASIGLASQAALELQGTSPERAVLLALEALENYPYTWQAERALGDAVFNNHLELILEHDAWVNTATWSPDQTMILTACDDGAARVWDAQTGDLIFTFEHDDWVPSALWSPSGDRILTYSPGENGFEGAIKLWDTGTGELIRSLNLGDGKFYKADWSRDGSQVLVSARDGNTQIWDLESGTQLFTLEASRACGSYGCTLGKRAWSPAGDRILTQNNEGGFQIWGAETGELIYQVQASEDVITNAAWSPSGDRFFTIAEDDLIVWDAIDAEEGIRLTGHSADIAMAMWSPSGDYILTGGNDTTARVWDALTGEELVMFDDHNNTVWTAVWSPSGSLVVTGSGDGTAKVWDPFTGEAVQTFLGHDANVEFADWSQDERQVLTTGPDGAVNVWNLTHETELLEIASGEGGWVSLSWSADGSRIARPFLDGYIAIYDTALGEELIKFPAHDSDVGCVAFSYSGKYVATVSGSSSRVWEVSTGELVTSFDGHSGNLFCARWSPDDRRIATTSYSTSDPTVRIWDAMTGEEQLVFDAHGYAIWAEWSPDGSRIASVGSPKAFVWDAHTGDIQLTLYPDEYSFPVAAVVWSPDGERLATHATDGILRIWDATSGEELIAVPGHSAQLYEMDWFPSGEWLLSADTDGVYKFFDTESGEEIFSTRLPGYFEAVLSPDGARFATSSSPGGPIKIFSTWRSRDELIAYARECCMVRELSVEEREKFGLVAEGTNDG